MSLLNSQINGYFGVTLIKYLSQETLLRLIRSRREAGGIDRSNKQSNNQLNLLVTEIMRLIAEGNLLTDQRGWAYDWFLNRKVIYLRYILRRVIYHEQILENAFEGACQGKHRDLIEEYLLKPILDTSTDLTNGFEIAIKSKDVDFVKWLYEKFYGLISIRSLIPVIIECGSYPMIEFFVQNGTNLNRFEMQNEAPTHLKPIIEVYRRTQATNKRKLKEIDEIDQLSHLTQRLKL